MENQLLLYKSSIISYYRFGVGPKLVVCFHGYGEDAAVFDFLAKHDDNQHTFISVDLPFHGQTAWNEGLRFTINDLQKIIETIPELKNSRPIILGFSLGGRVALSLYQVMAGQIEKIILLAPDGLKLNSWYWLSTQTWMGKNLFAFTMKHPGWFFGMLKIFNKLGVVNASIFKFVNYYIGNPKARQLLYQRWIVLRKLKPDISTIKSFIAKYKTATRLLYGKHDRIILPERGERFKRGIEEQCTLTVIPSGHQVLHERHASEIMEALNN